MKRSQLLSIYLSFVMKMITFSQQWSEWRSTEFSISHFAMYFSDKIEIRGAIKIMCIVFLFNRVVVIEWCRLKLHRNSSITVIGAWTWVCILLQVGLVWDAAHYVNQRYQLKKEGLGSSISRKSTCLYYLDRWMSGRYRFSCCHPMLCRARTVCPGRFYPGHMSHNDDSLYS